MQAGPRWRADVFLFLKWVWLSRLYRRVDSGDAPPPVRVLRSLERSRPSVAAKQPSCPSSSSKRRARPISARRQAPASAWGHPSCPSPPASAILPVLARWLRRRMRQASSPPAPSWFILLRLGSTRAVVLLRRLLLCGRHASAHEQRHARQHDQMLPHDTSSFSRCSRICRS
jgi:hypothetical protein